MIHTVGPIWRGGDAHEERILADAYRNSLTLADERSLNSVAFPSISTGVYGFPIGKASGIVKKTLEEYFSKRNSGIQTVILVLFSSDDFEVYRKQFGLG